MMQNRICKKLFFILVLISTLSIAFFISPKKTFAECIQQSSCCTNQVLVNTPLNCSPGCLPFDPTCTVCTGQTLVCTANVTNVCVSGPGTCSPGAEATACLDSFACQSAPTCPAGFVFCSGCGCMPNTQNCSYWIANACGNTGGGGPGPGDASCPSGGACFTGIANCGLAGRHVQTGTCSIGGVPGICCDFASGGAECTASWQSDGPNTNPSVMEVGQTAKFRTYAAGSIGWPCIIEFWPAGSPALGIWTPSWFIDASGAYCEVNLQATVVGFSRMRMKYIDYADYNNIHCSTERFLTVLPPACTPSCAQMCGQPDGCGGTCGNADAGAPTAPTNLQPSGDVIVTSSTVPVSWGASSPANSYEVEIYPLGSDCSDPLALCTVVAGTSINYTISSSVTTYTARVRAVNSICTLISGTATQYSAWVTTNFTPVAAITGTFYQDDISACVPGAPIAINGNVTITDKNTNPTTATLTGGNTGYQGLVPFWSPGGNNIVVLNPGFDTLGNQLYCACNAVDPLNPILCAYAGINSPQANVNFFLTPVMPQQGWFQAYGGQIYAGGVSGDVIRSPISPPTFCTTPGCKPALSATNLDDTLFSDGPVFTAGGTVDTAGYTTQRTPNAVMTELPSTNFQQGYDYFYNRFSLGTNPPDEFPGEHAAGSSSSKPGGNGVFFSNGDLRIADNAWNLGAGEEITIFVDGNLTIDDTSGAEDMIRVQNGGAGNSGFLAFIVSGNITVTGNVGNADVTDETPNLEGIYIADGSITIQSSGAGDKRFIGEGNFIGWGGVSLLRNLTVVENQTTPAELFIFRPEFVRDLPEEMKEPIYLWQEVNP